MEDIRVGSWVKYKASEAPYRGDPFGNLNGTVPTVDTPKHEVWAVVIKVDDDNCTITWKEDVVYEKKSSHKLYQQSEQWLHQLIQ